MSKIALTPNASGSGTFTIAAPNSNTDRTLTLPDEAGTVVTTGSTGAVTQTMLASGISGNGPAFRVNRSTTFNPSGSTWTKVPLNSEDFDTNNNFDNATNYRFTPTVDGYYQINAHAFVTGSPSECYVALYKNGSNVAYSLFNGSGTGQWTGMVSDVWSANGTTDYFEMYVWTNASSPAISGMYMSGFLARNA